MEITRHGPRCFHLKSSDLTVLTDPVEDGQAADAPETDVIVWSAEDGEAEEATGRAGKRLIRGPGEYEISGVFIHGVRTYRDTEKGASRGRNTAYTVSMDNVQVCYLGRIGHTPTSDHASALGDVDVLLVPVGDEGLDIAAVAETVGVLEPRLIIPVGAPTESEVAAVAKETGAAMQPLSEKLSVSRSSLPAEPQIAELSAGAPGGGPNAS